MKFNEVSDCCVYVEGKKLFSAQHKLHIMRFDNIPSPPLPPPASLLPLFNFSPSFPINVKGTKEENM